MSHTPAPWNLEPPAVLGEASVRFGSKGSDDGCAMIIANTGKYEIARANARLIAAAPDLLDAMKVILDGFKLGIFCRNTDHDDDPKWALGCAVQLAALAKAQRAIANVESAEPVGLSGAK